MSYALYDTATGQIVAAVPSLGKFRYEGADIHGATPGWTTGTVKLVELVEAGVAPTPYHDPTTSAMQLNGNVVTRTWLFAPQSLAAVKADLSNRIDLDAGAERAKYLSAGTGQGETYLEKAREAREFSALVDQDGQAVDDWPWLATEIDAGRASTLTQAMNNVMTQYNAWKQIGRAIDATRLAAKDAVNAAVTVESAWAAYQAVTWPGA